MKADEPAVIDLAGAGFDIGPFVLLIEATNRTVRQRLSRVFSGFPRVVVEEGEPAKVVVVSVSEVEGVETGGPRFQIARDGVVLSAAKPLVMVEEHITRLVNRWCLDEEPERLHLHAGAVRRGGDTVLIVGTSHAGKSTLVAKLVASGWEYLSDEQLGVTADGRLIRYPRSLSLRRESWQFFADVPSVKAAAAGIDAGRIEVPPGELGLVERRSPTTPTLIVCPDVSVDLFEVRRLSSAECFSALVGDTLDLERAGEVGIQAILSLVASAPAYRVAGRFLASTCRAVDSLSATATAPGAPLDVHTVESDSSAATTAWLFVDDSATIHDRTTGMTATVDRPGFAAWLQLVQPQPDVEAVPASFRDEMLAAGLV